MHLQQRCIYRYLMLSAFQSILVVSRVSIYSNFSVTKETQKFIYLSQINFEVKTSESVSDGISSS